MRIAHIAPTARSNISAAWRIRQAQQDAGHDAFALVHVGMPGSHVTLFRPPSLSNAVKTRIIARLDTIPIRVSRDRQRDLPWSAGWTGFSASSRINEETPDIVNLHWATNGCINLRDLYRVSCPIVMTLHDVWPITGGCHCNLGCDGWSRGCVDCPQLREGPFGMQVAHGLWLAKQHAYAKISKLAIVTPSRWLGEMASRSELLASRRVEVIPNCLDLNIFRPCQKDMIRCELGLPLDRRIIAFGAVNATSTGYKGFHLLIDALRRLAHDSDKPYHLLVFGSTGDTRDLPYPVTFLGNLHDEHLIAKAYQAADVFVTPSQQDNFPSTLIEASACGVAMVGFNVGGIPEIVGHEERGYIARSFDTDDFARGIAWVTRSPESILSLGSKARSFALANVAPDVVAQKYINLYSELLS